MCAWVYIRVCVYMCMQAHVQVIGEEVFANGVASDLFSPQLIPIEISAMWTNSKFQVQTLGSDSVLFQSCGMSFHPTGSKGTW